MKFMHNDIINIRLLDNESYFFVDYGVVRQCGNFDIIRRREWMGISMHDDIKNILLETIADDININGSIATIKIENHWALFDISQCLFLLPPEYDALQMNSSEDTITLEQHNKLGLYSLRERRVVIQPIFDDCTNNDNEYLWVRSGAVYKYVRKNDGTVINTNDADMAYDIDNNMIVRHGDSVICLNAKGYEDELALRRLVISGQGRLKINNFKLHICNIIDIYGYILD